MITIDGVNTNRSLQEICGGTITTFTFIPYFSTLYTNTMIATDKQINATLLSLAAEGKVMETSPTQSNGVFYIATTSLGAYLSLNLGKISDGILVPIANRNYAFKASQFPNSAFVFTDPTYNITQIISTSAYNTNFGPYAMPTFDQSIPTTSTVATDSPIRTSFIINVPSLFVLNAQNALVPTTGEIVLLQTPQMPVSVLTPFLKEGISIMTLSTVQSVFGTNANIPLNITINKTTGAKDETQNYAFFCNSSSNFIYAVYNNNATTAKLTTFPTTPKHAVKIMLTGTSRTQSSAGDVFNLAILGNTYSSVPVQPATISTPEVLPMQAPVTPEEVHQQAFYETTQNPKKSFYAKNKTFIFVAIGVFCAIALSAMLYLIIRFYWKKPILDNAATPTAPTPAQTTPTPTQTTTPT